MYRNFNPPLIFSLAILSGLLSACTGVPKGLEPVTGFDVNRYAGRWYEIARLDHSFERGLSRVSATYTIMENGRLQVVNRGFDTKKGKWKTIAGRAAFTGNASVGSLKVSFFGPFYGGYHIIELDRKNYQYAMVAGPSRSYLWILARSPELAPTVLERLVAKADRLGFATEKLIFVDQTPPSG